MESFYSAAGHPVYRFSMPVIDSSMYLIPGKDSCVIVDPCVSGEAEELLRELCVRDCLILLTHEHYDHISGVNRLRDLLPCQVVCTEKCAERIANPKKNAAAYAAALVIGKSGEEQAEFGKLLDAGYVCQADQTYSGRLEIPWEDLTLVLRETPGHSPGSQVIEIGKRWYFTGDSLIPGVKVITRFPGGSKQDFEEITKPYLARIPPGSVLFPGHGEAAVFDGRLEA